MLSCECLSPWNALEFLCFYTLFWIFHLYLGCREQLWWPWFWICLLYCCWGGWGLMDCCCDWMNLWCHWLRAQEGNWQCLSAVLMWSSSLSKVSCVDETVLALCARVLNTLCLAVMWWLLSQCRYWSVWVRFLYTVVLRVLSGWMRVSKKGSEPCCVGSTVNWMCGSWLFICWRSSWLCSALLMTKVSSTNLSQREGGGGRRRGL